MIFLASPYSGTKQQQEDRYRENMACVAAFTKQGEHLISPILHCHDMALTYQLPQDWQFWRSYNEALLRRCDQLWILALPGWETSKGVTAELEFAERRRIPVSLVNIRGSRYTVTFHTSYLEAT